MGDLTAHFSRSELACKHCGLFNATVFLLDALEELRSLGPEAIIIHDGCRCAEHNVAVGGVKDSEHLLGIAADLEIAGLSLQQMYERAEKVGAFRNGGIGVYDHQAFIHVDARGHRARWARVNGAYLPIAKLVTPVLYAPS